MSSKTLKLLPLIIILAIFAIVWFFSQKSSVPPTPEFSQYAAGPERKQVFFDYFAPIIAQENQKILEQREQILALQTKEELASRDVSFLKEIAKQYYIDEFDTDNAAHWLTLLRRVDYIPPSLALAQAANESAWGTSRFATQGNNYFGQWCFSEGCGLVPKSRGEGQSHEVAAFDSAQESVERYLLNLNRHDAYVKLRKIRETIRDNENQLKGPALLPGLEKYSERGKHYMEELNDMISFNKLLNYDANFSELLTTGANEENQS